MGTLRERNFRMHLIALLYPPFCCTRVMIFLGGISCDKRKGGARGLRNGDSSTLEMVLMLCSQFSLSIDSPAADKREFGWLI